MQRKQNEHGDSTALHGAGAVAVAGNLGWTVGGHLGWAHSGEARGTATGNGRFAWASRCRRAGRGRLTGRGTRGGAATRALLTKRIHFVCSSETIKINDHLRLFRSKKKSYEESVFPSPLKIDGMKLKDSILKHSLEWVLHWVGKWRYIYTLQMDELPQTIKNSILLMNLAGSMHICIPWGKTALQ